MTPPAYGKLHFPFNILYFLYSFSFSPLPFHSYNKVQNKVSFSSSPFSNFVWIKRSPLRKFPRSLWSLDRIYSWKSFESRARKVEDETAVTTVRFATRTEDGRIGRRGSPFFEDGMDASAARADPSFLIKLSEARFLVPVASRLEARDRFTRAGNRELEVGWTL